MSRIEGGNEQPMFDTDMSAEMASELAGLEALDDGALVDVVHEMVADVDPDEIEDLLEKHRTDALTDVERARLEAIHRAANRTMLRKARAAVLLRARGRHVPTLEEMADRWAQRG